MLPARSPLSTISSLCIPKPAPNRYAIESPEGTPSQATGPRPRPEHHAARTTPHPAGGPPPPQLIHARPRPSRSTSEGKTGTPMSAHPVALGICPSGTQKNPPSEVSWFIRCAHPLKHWSGDDPSRHNHSPFPSRMQHHHQPLSEILPSSPLTHSYRMDTPFPTFEKPVSKTPKDTLSRIPERASRNQGALAWRIKECKTPPLLTIRRPRKPGRDPLADEARDPQKPRHTPPGVASLVTLV
ncbi:hypothetical protein EAI_05729 [Harpegnathos saltator]|uniref:Uncharacterized protein n=1 Tax=Harpegnathos saltator TaxID=610380 RepID=E2C4U5_HARSA|nr:hypothetical protein EAI_05729 [Harpegnathos saltator]